MELLRNLSHFHDVLEEDLYMGMTEHLHSKSLSLLLPHCQSGTWRCSLMARQEKKAFLGLFLLLLWLKTHLAKIWKEEETTNACNVAKALLDKKSWEKGWAGSSLSSHWDLCSSHDLGAGTASTRGAYGFCCFKVICVFTLWNCYGFFYLWRARLLSHRRSFLITGVETPGL